MATDSGGHGSGRAVTSVEHVCHTMRRKQPVVCKTGGGGAGPPEAARLKMPPAALPGANLLPDLKEWGYQTGLFNKILGQSKA